MFICRLAGIGVSSVKISVERTKRLKILHLLKPKHFPQVSYEQNLTSKRKKNVEALTYKN